MSYKLLLILPLLLTGCATKYIEPENPNVATIKLLHKMPQGSHSTLYKYTEPYCSPNSTERMIRIGRSLFIQSQQGEVKVMADKKISLLLSTSASYTQSPSSSITSSCAVSITFIPIKNHTYEIFQHTPTFGHCSTFVRDLTTKKEPVDLELKSMTDACK